MRNKVVDPFDVVGTLTVLFSVLTHVIVSATPLKSRMRTIVIWPSTALEVAIVIVIVAAELLLNVLSRDVTGTVPAFVVTETALLTSIMLLNLFCAVHVCAVPNPPTVSVEFGKVIIELVPLEVRVIV